MNKKEEKKKSVFDDPSVEEAQEKEQEAKKAQEKELAEKKEQEDHEEAKKKEEQEKELLAQKEKEEQEKEQKEHSVEDLHSLFKTDKDLTSHDASVQWEKVFNPFLKSFENAGKQKNVTDMVEGFALDFMCAFLESIAVLMQEKAQSMKKNSELTLQNRQKHIESSLSENHLNMAKAVDRIVQDVHDWLLDDTYVLRDADGQIVERGLTPFRKAHLAKYRACKKLPKTPSGALDFRQFKNAHRRVFAKYLKAYVWGSPAFRRFAHDAMGVRLTYDEQKDFLTQALRRALDKKNPYCVAHHRRPMQLQLNQHQRAAS